MSGKMYTCGVPKEHCNGAHVATSAGTREIENLYKAHVSPSQAFNCRARYLTHVLGYERIGQREFSPPDGGPVLVLSKKIRFGGKLRKGKGARGDGSASRVMPDRPHVGGLIAGY